MNTLELWHEIVHERNPDRLDEVLAEDCVFLSPIVHTPQEGTGVDQILPDRRF